MRMRIIAACGALFLSIPAIHAQTPDTDTESTSPDTTSPPVTTSPPDTNSSSYAVRAPRPVAHATHLGPGGFIWRPELAPSGEMSMTIDLSRQRAYIRRDGVCIGVTTVSTGKPGYETPTGEYSVLEKERFHRSNRYQQRADALYAAPDGLWDGVAWGTFAGLSGFSRLHTLAARLRGSPVQGTQHWHECHHHGSKQE